MTPPPSLSSNSQRTAFVVMAPSGLRRTLVGGLRQRGFRVQVADEPFAAAARLKDGPCDLVLTSLDTFAPGDEGFFAAVVRRAPATLLVALVGEDEHEQGRSALQAGARAWLPRPQGDDDVSGVLQALDVLTACGGRDAMGALGPLGHELAHLFGNRLMALVGISNDVDLPDELLARHERAVASIREGTRRLARIQELPPREPRLTDLRELTEASLAPLVDRGTLQPFEVRVKGRPQVTLDRHGVRFALEAAADALAGLSARSAPVALDARIARPRNDLLAFMPPSCETVRLVEVRLRVPGFHLDRAALGQCRRQVIWVQDRTHRVHWGLWATEQVLQRNGARLLPSRGASGSGFRLVFRLA